jgi:hypothetical protein
VVAALVIGTFVVVVAATTVSLIRQRRFYAPPPSDLRRADDTGSADYSEYEHGHDIATGYVERGGSF